MNNRGEIPAPPPLDMDNFIEAYNCWANESPIAGEDLDGSMPRIDVDFAGLPGTTPPQTVSHAADGDGVPSFDDVPGPSPPSSAKNHGGQPRMNSADLVRASSSLGEREHAGISGIRNEKIASDHRGDEAGTSQKVAPGSAVQGAPAGPGSDHRKSTDQLMASNFKERRSDKPSIGTFCIQDGAAQLKPNAKSGDHLKDSSTQARSRTSNQVKSPGRNAWSEKFKLLEKYKADHGDTDVPQRLHLGTWVNKQRMEKKKFDKGEKTSMNQERIKRLESIGFKWAKPKGQISWNERFEELKAYKDKHGHCIVPTRNYKENTALGRWITSQRALKKEGDISKDNEKKLNEIGFVWDRYDNKGSHDTNRVGV